MRWRKKKKEKKIKEIQSEFSVASDHRHKGKPSEVRWRCGKNGKSKSA